MLPGRHNAGAKRNPQVEEVPRRKRDNDDWLRAARKELPSGPSVVLLGGRDVVHYRARVAQSHVRHDLVPSHWSHVILAHPTRSNQYLHVPLTPVESSTVPATNAIAPIKARDVREPSTFPNIGVLVFPTADPKAMSKRIEVLKMSRLAVDFVSDLVPWLAFAWGARGAGNPLLQGTGMPSTAFVDEVFAAGGVDIVPGLAERCPCPEAIWQAALWWSDYYEATHSSERDANDASRGQPVGRYTLDHHTL